MAGRRGMCWRGSVARAWVACRSHRRRHVTRRRTVEGISPEGEVDPREGEPHLGRHSHALDRNQRRGARRRARDIPGVPLRRRLRANTAAARPVRFPFSHDPHRLLVRLMFSSASPLPLSPRPPVPFLWAADCCGRTSTFHVHHLQAARYSARHTKQRAGSRTEGAEGRLSQLPSTPLLRGA